MKIENGYYSDIPLKYKYILTSGAGLGRGSPNLEDKKDENME